jgi:hypothetical protein
MRGRIALQSTACENPVQRSILFRDSFGSAQASPRRFWQKASAFVTLLAPSSSESSTSLAPADKERGQRRNIHGNFSLFEHDVLAREQILQLRRGDLRTRIDRNVVRQFRPIQNYQYPVVEISPDEGKTIVFAQQSAPTAIAQGRMRAA